jgi:hypothetical protein
MTERNHRSSRPDDRMTELSPLALRARARREPVESSVIRSSTQSRYTHLYDRYDRTFDLSPTRAHAYTRRAINETSVISVISSPESGAA